MFPQKLLLTLKMNPVPDMGPSQATVLKTFPCQKHSTEVKGGSGFGEGSGILIRKDLGDCETAQQVKALVVKTKGLSLISGIHVVEGENS